MREHLLGYLLGALEPTEHDRVAARLDEDPRLQAELVCLREKLKPLEADEEPFEPPAGLAARTCRCVDRISRSRRHAAAGERGSAVTPAAPSGAWRMQDMFVAGGIALAACLLIFPALSASRFQARRDACENNLRALGMALLHYSDLHGGYFPVVPSQGPLAVAGMYAPTLCGLGFLDGPTSLICPAASPRSVELEVPALDEIAHAAPAQLAVWQRQMGGDYGYALGYYDAGVYRGHKNRGRASFALMADAPQREQPGCRSANHSGRGQNVLFEDCHVRFLTNCCLADCGDHIYHNGHGYVGAGIDADDAVIGASDTRPLMFQERSANPER